MNWLYEHFNIAEARFTPYACNKRVDNDNVRARGSLSFKWILETSFLSSVVRTVR